MLVKSKKKFEEFVQEVFEVSLNSPVKYGIKRVEDETSKWWCGYIFVPFKLSLLPCVSFTEEFEGGWVYGFDRMGLSDCSEKEMKAIVRDFVWEFSELDFYLKFKTRY